MTCKDCPEPTIPEGVIGWVVYTGGPACLHLATMQSTLPSDFHMARFLPDGSIQYVKSDWEPPSPIEGYEQTGDEWLFRPMWKSCQLRMYGTVIKDNCQCIQVLAVCNHPETELNEHGEVTFEMCEACQRRVPIPEPIIPQQINILPQKNKSVLRKTNS